MTWLLGSLTLSISSWRLRYDLEEPCLSSISVMSVHVYVYVLIWAEWLTVRGSSRIDMLCATVLLLDLTLPSHALPSHTCGANFSSISSHSVLPSTPEVWNHESPGSAHAWITTIEDEAAFSFNSILFFPFFLTFIFSFFLLYARAVHIFLSWIN